MSSAIARFTEVPLWSPTWPALFVRVCEAQEWRPWPSIFPATARWSRTRMTTLPVDRRSYGDVLDDIQPFEKLIQRRQVAAVMMAHVVYIEMHSSPAGFSSNWIQRELRSQLGFDGAVFCDDLSMKATEGFGQIEKRARLALSAGCDMVPICNDRDCCSARRCGLVRRFQPAFAGAIGPLARHWRQFARIVVGERRMAGGVRGAAYLAGPAGVWS